MKRARTRWLDFLNKSSVDQAKKAWFSLVLRLRIENTLSICRLLAESFLPQEKMLSERALTESSIVGSFNSLNSFVILPISIFFPYKICDCNSLTFRIRDSFKFWLLLSCLSKRSVSVLQYEASSFILDMACTKPATSEPCDGHPSLVASMSENHSDSADIRLFHFSLFALVTSQNLAL